MKQVVIMPGGFHPFHAGHYALYKQAQDAFPGADVYVAATNDTSARPFPFAVKEKLAKLAGVAPGHFVQVKSPFQAREITANLDPENTELIFVRSEKDANKPPQAGGVKKDGNPAYLQPYTGNNLEPMNRHAYMAYLPTVEFGPGMTSATEIRNAWPTLNEKRKTALVMSLYPKTQTNPKLAATVVKMLDTAMGSELDEAISRRGILKGLAGAGALGAAGKASAIAGAFPTPSAQAAMYKAAADSNRAQARADAAAKAKADAERLKKNTELVDKEQRVNHHKLDEFAPDGFDGFEDDNRVPMHFVVEKELYNRRSKWKKSRDADGVILFATKQQAIQAAEKFNKIDPNREFAYGGTQMVHVDDEDLDEGFDREEFRRQMKDLEAREELRKTDPVSAKALDLRGQLPQVSKKKPEDDSISINDPRHPGYAYTQVGQHKLDESNNEYILYINNKPAAKYTDIKQAEQDLVLIKSKVPSAKFEIKQEVCNMVPVPVGLKEAILKELRIFHPADKPGMIDVYYRPGGTHSNERRVVAKNIPYRSLDLLTKAMTKKFGIGAEDLEVIPVDQPYGERLREFAPDEGDGSRKFIPWTEFIEQLKQILHKDFDCVENVVKSTIKARFVPHDPMEYGPTMLYSYYETRGGGRNKGAISTRGSIQVGKYTKGGLFGQAPDQLLTGFHLLKGTPFERHFDLTFDNIYKIANIIKGNTQGALEFKPEGVAEVRELPGKDKLAGATAAPAESARLKNILLSHIDEVREFVATGDLDSTGDLFQELYEYFANGIPEPVRQDPWRLSRRIQNLIASPAKFYAGAQNMNEQGVAEEAGPVEAYGYVYDRSDQRVMWRKTFPSEQAAKAWADSKNATIMGMKSAQQSMSEDYVDEKK